MKSNDLRSLATGQKCKSVSSKIIGNLISILIKKGVSFAWDALQIYHTYQYQKISQEKQKLLPTLYNLLKRDNLLFKKERYDALDDFYYEEAIEEIISSDYGKDFSKYFVSHIIKTKVSLYDLPISLETIRKCFTKIIPKIS